MTPNGLRVGQVLGVNGSVVTARFDGEVRQNEVAHVCAGSLRLKAEVVRLRGLEAELQVFETTSGLRVGDRVEFSGELLSVQLGPGLLGQLFDGLQNPLPRLAEISGYFLKRGTYLPALEPARRWAFTPTVEPGQVVEAGATLGSVPEGQFQHRIMVPFHQRGSLRLREVAAPGEYDLEKTLVKAENAEGEEVGLGMSFRWPIRRPIQAYAERLAPVQALATQIRLIDTLFPVALGGTYCVPGPFGAGKTVLQQLISRYAAVDIVIVAACGERAAEVVETIRDFPELEDPRTGRPLMDRTIIICNTSSMPVAAREASVYTAVTLAEYYRQMGLHVLLLADSTSRWAQALRERSGRLEEIPGEEAFPAYLESVVAQFYERAGIVRLKDGQVGSVTIGGTVSPAGGNFEEPVTQATLKVVGAFQALSRERSDARRFPAIDPLESWSRYQGIVAPARRGALRQALARAYEIEQMMKVVGEEGTSLDDYVAYLKGELFDAVFLQQNAFDPVDAATPPERQLAAFALIERLMSQTLPFSSKQTARTFFNRLRLKILDWNGTPWGTEPCRQQAAELHALLDQAAAQPAASPSGITPARERFLENQLDSDFRRSPTMRTESRRDLGMEEHDADDQQPN